MSESRTEPAERITLDDLKHRVETVTDMAVTDAKEMAAKVVSEDPGRTVLIAAGVVLLAVSLAYFLGTRSAQRAAMGPE